MIAEATVFVSHAWRYRFVEVLQTLEEYAEREGSAETTYFWFDLVCNNQHGAPNLPQVRGAWRVAGGPWPVELPPGRRALGEQACA